MACPNCEPKPLGNDRDRCIAAMNAISMAVQHIGDCKLPTMLHDTSLVLLQQTRRLVNEMIPPMAGNETTDQPHRSNAGF